MKNCLEYKGYAGSVEFSEEDNCLFGKVLGIRSLISYEGDSVDSLRKDFQDSIDDYLAVCAENGTEPEIPYKGTFNVRVSPEIHREAAMRALELGTSLNGFVSTALEHAIHSATANP